MIKNYCNGIFKNFFLLFFLLFFKTGLLWKFLTVPIFVKWQTQQGMKYLFSPQYISIVIFMVHLFQN